MGQCCKPESDYDRERDFRKLHPTAVLQPQSEKEDITCYDIHKMVDCTTDLNKTSATATYNPYPNSPSLFDPEDTSLHAWFLPSKEKAFLTGNFVDNGELLCEHRYGFAVGIEVDRPPPSYITGDIPDEITLTAPDGLTWADWLQSHIDHSLKTKSSEGIKRLKDNSRLHKLRDSIPKLNAPYRFDWESEVGFVIAEDPDAPTRKLEFEVTGPNKHTGSVGVKSFRVYSSTGIFDQGELRDIETDGPILKMPGSSKKDYISDSLSAICG